MAQISAQSSGIANSSLQIIAPAVNVPPGAALYVFTSRPSSSPLAGAPTDSAGNSFGRVANVVQQGGLNTIELWVADNCFGNANDIVKWNVALSGNLAISVLVITGQANPSLDVSTTAKALSTIASASVSPNQSAELGLAAVVYDTTTPRFSASAGSVQVNAVTNNSISLAAVQGSASVGPAAFALGGTFPTSANWGEIVVGVLTLTTPASGGGSGSGGGITAPNTSQSGNAAGKTCVTRGIKNAITLSKQNAALNAPNAGLLFPGFNPQYIVPASEPAAGYWSILPLSGISNINRINPESGYGLVIFNKNPSGSSLQPLGAGTSPPASTPSGSPPSTFGPLFDGVLHIVQLSVKNSNSTFVLSSADMATLQTYYSQVAQIIQQYSAQYGPCSIKVDSTIYAATLQLSGSGVTYNDQTLQGNVNSSPVTGGLIDQIAAANGWTAGGPTAHCIVIVGPPGSTNTDADSSQGVLGYHNLSAVNNVPYIYFGLTAGGLTSADGADVYQIVASHELAELMVDPSANLSNPEVCDPCFPAGTVILGDNKPIEQYAIGDQVVGQHGLQLVTKIYSRHYSGDLYSVKAMGMLPVNATDNHPFLVTTGHLKRNSMVYSHPEWKRADQLIPKVRGRDGHYLVVPKLKGTIDTNEVSLQRYIDKHASELINASTFYHSNVFPLNQDTAWLLGLYVAEGSRDGNGAGVGFSLNENETEYIERVKSIAKTLGINTWYEKSSDKWKSVKIHVSSTIYAMFLDDVCGHGASNKKIPDFVLYHKDDKIISSFLEGYLDGDGSINEISNGTNPYLKYELTEFKTVSKILAEQVQLLCARLGIFASLDLYREAQKIVILGRETNCKDTYRGRWTSGSGTNKKTRLSSDGSSYYIPIKSIDKLPYDGDVFNLETEDHTYLASNAVTHNCGPNCQPLYRDFFDQTGAYVGTQTFFPPIGLQYAFMINAIVTPSSSSSTSCGVPVGSCAYSPTGGGTFPAPQNVGNFGLPFTFPPSPFVVPSGAFTLQFPGGFDTGQVVPVPTSLAPAGITVIKLPLPGFGA